jgi:hypothetical protein
MDFLVIQNEHDFLKQADTLFSLQKTENHVFGNYCNLVEKQISKSKMPYVFLPVSFFKTHEIKTGNFTPQMVFSSSSTSGTGQAFHYVKDMAVYEASFKKTFELFYGDVKHYRIMALLPSYLEREGSSLVYMMDKLIHGSGNHESGFYLHNMDELATQLKKPSSCKTLLLGVSFALLDFAEQFSFPLTNTIIMETGGMKGKRKEVTREELHQVLCRSYGVHQIHSEYGMAELLSQAYATQNGRFYPPPWMKIFIRDMYDPFEILEDGKAGGINIIDLANESSCAFIETQDIGRKFADGSFEVLGRYDQSEVRGCNLLVQ